MLQVSMDTIALSHFIVFLGQLVSSVSAVTISNAVCPLNIWSLSSYYSDPSCFVLLS